VLFSIRNSFGCRRRGDACSWMVWTPQVRPSRSDTKAPANSTANTAVSLANHRCGIFGPFARQALRRWSRSVVGKTPSDRDSFREAPLKVRLPECGRSWAFGHPEAIHMAASSPYPANLCPLSFGIEFAGL